MIAADRPTGPAPPIASVAKALAYRMLHWAGFTRMAAWLMRDRVLILCYHGVTERRVRHSGDAYGLHVRRDRFAAQLDYLERHWRVMSLSEYVHRRSRGLTVPPRTAIVTFDDGYRNFLTVAVPELRKRGICSAMFLITDLTAPDGRATSTSWSDLDDSERISWSEARHALRDGDIEFGSHSRAHRDLTSLTPEAMTDDLATARLALEQRLGLRSPALAYPYGRHDRAVASCALASGYSCALTTDEGLNASDTDLFQLRRILIGDDDDEAAFATRACGVVAAMRGVGARGRRLLPSRWSADRASSSLTGAVSCAPS